MSLAIILFLLLGLFLLLLPERGLCPKVLSLVGTTVMLMDVLELQHMEMKESGRCEFDASAAVGTGAKADAAAKAGATVEAKLKAAPKAPAGTAGATAACGCQEQE